MHAWVVPWPWLARAVACKVGGCGERAEDWVNKLVNYELALKLKIENIIMLKIENVANTTKTTKTTKTTNSRKQSCDSLLRQ